MSRQLFSRGVIAAMLLIFAATTQAQDKPNMLIIWGDDIGQSNISAYTFGLMGYCRTVG